MTQGATVDQECKLFWRKISLISGESALWTVSASTYSVSVRIFVDRGVWGEKIEASQTRTFGEPELQALSVQIQQFSQSAVGQADNFAQCLKQVKLFRDRLEERARQGYVDAALTGTMKVLGEVIAGKKVEGVTGDLPQTETELVKRFGVNPILIRKMGEGDENAIKVVGHMCGRGKSSHPVKPVQRAEGPYTAGLSFVKNHMSSASAQDVVWSASSDPVILRATEALNHMKSKQPIVVKTARLGHVLHPVLPIFFMLNNWEKVFTAENVVLCRRNSGFASVMRRIHERTDDEYVFFVHPENLDKDEQAMLIDLCETRMHQSEVKGPRLVIVTSYANFLPSGLPLDRTLFISDDDISVYCDITGRWFMKRLGKNNQDWMTAYASRRSGTGKTTRIKQECTRYGTTENTRRIFCDLTTKDLPRFEGNTTYHLELSPELFDNEFEFFDDMWMGCLFGGVVLENGDLACPGLCNRILFELPVLTESRMPEVWNGNSMEIKWRRCDFPISMVSDSAMVVVPDEPVVFPLRGSLRDYADLVFKDTPESCNALLKQAARVFFTEQEADLVPNFFTTRVIAKAEMFLLKMIEKIRRDHEDAGRLFVLILRTVFHYCLFETQTPKLLLIPQQLEVSSQGETTWVLLGLPDNRAWNIDSLKTLLDGPGEISDATWFNEDTWKQSVPHRLKIDGNVSPSQFALFGTILSFFPAIQQREDFKGIASGMLLKEWRLNPDNVLGPQETRSDNFRACYQRYTEREKTSSYEILTGMDCLVRIFPDKKNYDDESWLRDVENAYNKTYKHNSLLAQAVHMTYTLPFTMRFLILLLHVTLGEPLVLEGYTGCGKTSVIQLLFTLLKLSYSKDGDSQYAQWNPVTIDCHGNIQHEMITQTLDTCNTTNCKYVVFLDELNTSPASDFMIYLMMNNEKKIGVSNPPISFVAAINPHSVVSEISRALSRVGVKQDVSRAVSRLAMMRITPDREEEIWEDTDINALEYNVRELAKDTRYFVMLADPQCVKALGEGCEWLPAEEQDIIFGIVDQYLQDWNVGRERGHELEREEKHELCNFLKDVFVTTFQFVRGFFGLKSVLSYRDVKRTLIHFRNFYRKNITFHRKKKREENITDEMEGSHDELSVEKNIRDSVIVAVTLCLLCRFSTNTVIPEIFTPDEVERTQERCGEYGVEIQPDKQEHGYRINIRHTLEKRLRAVHWPEFLQTDGFVGPEQSWCDLFGQYAHFMCNKYIKETDMLQVPALMEHLFALKMCYSVERQCEFQTESIMPCLLIGPPGISKTKSLEIFLEYKHKRSAEKDKCFYSATYLASRVADTDSLNSTYQDCAFYKFQPSLDQNPSTSLKARDIVVICVIDELGLANVNPSRPLKLLHYYFDKGVPCSVNKYVRVMTFSTTNYEPDKSNQNRVISIAMEAPSPEEIEYGYHHRGEECRATSITAYKQQWDKMKKDCESQEKYLLKFVVERDLLKKGRMPMRAVLELYRILDRIRALKAPSPEEEHNIFCDFASAVLSAFCPDCHNGISFARQYMEWIGTEYDKGLREVCTRIIQHWTREDQQFEVLKYLLKSGTKKPTLIRTSRYEAWDHLNEIWKAIGIENFDVGFRGYPEDFAQSPEITSRRILDRYMEGIEGEATKVANKCVLFLGKVDAAEACLDILNSSGQEVTDRPLVSLNGYAIRLEKNPQRAKQIIFVLNQDDIAAHNEFVPLPVVDRLSSVYCDLTLLSKYLRTRHHEDKTNGQWKDWYNSAQQPRKEAIHLLSDAALFHKYFNSFHSSLESCLYYCRPDIWFKMHRPIIVTDHPNPERIFSPKETTPCQSQEMKRNVFVTTSIATAHEQARSSDAIVILKVNKEIPPGFMMSSEDHRVLTACPISRLKLTRYIFWNSGHAVLILYDEQPPRPDNDFRLVEITENDNVSSALEPYKEGYLAVVIRLAAGDVKGILTDISNVVNNHQKLYVAVILHVGYARETSNWQHLKLSFSGDNALGSQTPGGSIFDSSINTDFGSLEVLYHYFFQCQFKMDKCNIICSQDSQEDAVKSINETLGSKQIIQGPEARAELKAMNQICTAQAFDQAFRGKVLLLHFPERDSVRQPLDLTPFMKRHVSVFWVKSAPKTVFYRPCYPCSLKEDILLYRDLQEKKGVKRGILLWNEDCGVKFPSMEDPNIIFLDCLERLDQKRSDVDDKFAIAIVKYSKSHPVAWRNISGRFIDILVYDGLPHPRRIYEDRNIHQLHNGLDYMMDWLDKSSGKTQGQWSQAFVFTRSPMLAPLQLRGRRQFSVFIESSSNLSEWLQESKVGEATQGDDVFISAAAYIPEQHRQLMSLLDDGALGRNVIIYHMPNNDIPLDALGSAKRFGCWIESVANTSLRNFVISDCVALCMGSGDLQAALWAKCLEVVIDNICEKHATESLHVNKDFRLKLVSVATDRTRKTLDLSGFMHGLRDTISYHTANWQQDYANAILSHLPSKFESMVAISLRALPEQDIKELFEFMETYSHYLPDADTLPDNDDKEAGCVDLLFSSWTPLFADDPYIGPLQPIRDFVQLAAKFINVNRDSPSWIKSNKNYIFITGLPVADDMALMDDIWNKYFGRSYLRFLLKNGQTVASDYDAYEPQSLRQLSLEGRLAYSVKNMVIKLEGDDFGDLEAQDIAWDFFMATFRRNCGNLDASGAVLAAVRNMALVSGVELKSFLQSVIENKREMCLIGEEGKNFLAMYWLDRKVEDVCRSGGAIDFSQWKPNYLELFPGRDSEYESMVKGGLLSVPWSDGHTESSEQPMHWFDPFEMDTANCANLFEDEEDPLRHSFKPSSIRFPSSEAFVNYVTGQPCTVLDFIRNVFRNEPRSSDRNILEWLFEDTVPLLARQIYAVIHALYERDVQATKNEFIALSALLNPWNSDRKMCIRIWNNLVIELKRSPELLDCSNPENIIALMNRALTSNRIDECRCILYYCRPNCVLGDQWWNAPSLNYPSWDRMVLCTAMFHSYFMTEERAKENKDEKKKETQAYMTFLRSLPQVKLTKYLVPLYDFVSKIHKDFEDQTSLLYVIFKTLTCGDLTSSFGANVADHELYMKVQGYIENKEQFDGKLNELKEDEESSEKVEEELKEQVARCVGEASEQLTDGDFRFLGRFKADEKLLSSKSHLLCQIKQKLGDLRKQLGKQNDGSLKKPSDTYKKLRKWNQQPCDDIDTLVSADEEAQLNKRIRGLQLLIECLVPLNRNFQDILGQSREILSDAYTLLDVETPLVNMFNAIEDLFPASEWHCAYNQINEFVKLMCQVHNGCLFDGHLEWKRRPVKFVGQRDVIANMSFDNTILPYVWQPEYHLELREPAQIMWNALRILNGQTPIKKTVVTAMSKKNQILLEFSDEDFLGFNDSRASKDLFVNIDVNAKSEGNMTVQTRWFVKLRPALTARDATRESTTDRYDALRSLLPIFAYSEVGQDGQLVSSFFKGQCVVEAKPTYHFSATPPKQLAYHPRVVEVVKEFLEKAEIKLVNREGT